MAEDIKINLPANLPENFEWDQIIAPNGMDIGKPEQYGYNYLMKQVNAAQKALNQLTASVVAYSNSQFPEITNAQQMLDSLNENVESVRSMINSFESSLTLTVNIADLQTTINDIPKYLSRNVILNVNAGTYTGQITIENFVGPGYLSVVGASAITTTHNISNFRITNCNCASISIQGFNITATTGNAVFIAYCGSSYVSIDKCNIVGGSSTTSGLNGISTYFNHFTYVSNCTISNKNIAIRVDYARTIVQSISGTSNAVIYYILGGILHREISETITGETLTAISRGGLIINPSGAIIGT